MNQLYDKAEIDRLYAELAEVKAALGNILAVLNRDGGHRQAEVGTEQATEEGLAEFHAHRLAQETVERQLAEVKAELEVLRAAVSPDWREHEKARGKLSLALERAEAAENFVKFFPGGVARLQAELAEARALLKKYGDHHDDCPVNSLRSEDAGKPCSCGFRQALAAAKPGAER